MRDKLHRILDLMLELNEQGYTTFCDFVGHVEAIHIRVYKGKWKHEKEPCLYLCAYYEEDEEEMGDFTLNEIIEKLEELKVNI